MTVAPADHRYLQVARTLRKEIVDGVYPVGSQLPTEHELCERFAVSRYTVREALRRLRDDNLVSSRPRAGTMVVPRVSANSYAQDNMTINDLLAFASGAELDIESTGMVTIDAELAVAHRASRGRGMAGRPRLPPGRRRRVHALLDRVLHQPRVRGGRQAAATAHRPDLPAHRGSLRRQRRRGATRRSARSWSPRNSPNASRSPRARPPSRCTARTRPPTARSPRSPSTPTRPPASGTR